MSFITEVIDLQILEVSRVNIGMPKRIGMPNLVECFRNFNYSIFLTYSL